MISVLDIYIKSIFTLESSIKWCEEKYIISEYIAEFWNSFSGIALILTGFIFYNNNKLWLDKNEENKYNFIRIRNLLYVVGCGTILFHGSLLYIFQLIDEIPMLLLAREYIIILLSLEITKKTFLKSTYKNIVGFIHNLLEYIVIIISSYFVNTDLQIFCFHLTFKCLEFILICMFYNLSTSLNKIVYYKLTDQCIHHQCTEMLNIVQVKIKKYIELRRQLRNQIRKGLVFYILSISLWILENQFCDYTRVYQLHALWHVFSSIGIYFLNNIVKIMIDIDKFME
jgi:dihydroceramidase